jgi:hypothetical protein
MPGWTIRDDAVLFADHPPIQSVAPTEAECDALGLRLGRTRGAVSAQWNDARSLVLGSKGAASQGSARLRSRPWLAVTAPREIETALPPFARPPPEAAFG